jgi:hypothetical protein
MRWDSSIIISMGYGLNGWGSIPGRGKVIFFIFNTVQIGSEAHPASYLMGTWTPSPGVKRQGREAN